MNGRSFRDKALKMIGLGASGADFTKFASERQYLGMAACLDSGTENR